MSVSLLPSKVKTRGEVQGVIKIFPSTENGVTNDMYINESSFNV